MKRKMVYGLVGCGEIAVQTAGAIADSPNSEIGMVQDVNEEMARDLGEKFSVPWCLTWEELLGEKCIDVAYIATPHFLHADAAVAAAEAGKHILLEKPIATTLEDADRALAAAKRRGVKLSVAFTSRYTDRAGIIKEMIEDGAIGRIVGMDFGQYGYKPESYWSSGWTGRIKTDWRTSKAKSGGGVFLMNLVHTVDLLRYVTGLEVESVASNYDTFKTDAEVEDYLVAIMRYKGGAIGAVRTSTVVEGKAPAEALEGDRIMGLSGQIFIATDSLHVYFTREYKDYEPGKWHKIRMENPWGGREELVTHLSKALLCGKEPLITGLDGRKALEVCLAAYRSGETGEVVSLPM